VEGHVFVRHGSDASAGLAERAVVVAEALLRAAGEGQTPAERGQAEKIARLVEDPAGKALTLALVDQAFRSHDPVRIADQLRWLLARYGAPGYMEWWERVALVIGGVMSHYLPSLVVPPIVSRLRQETRSVIVPGEEDDLRRYLQERRRAGIRLNLNQLGEAILGEAEAHRRLEAYLALLARDDVEYISVKISSVFSQINLVAFRHTVDLIKTRLRALYRQALRHTYRHPDGRLTPKFINLDMEEYRDLGLTVAAFQEVLDEPEFVSLSAGLVLQAYLPDSWAAQQALTAWAVARCDRGGAPIKLRIVKGANLAMERVEASQCGWEQTPYETKAEVDANYARMVEYACRPEHARAVRVGIGSHNLFAIAHGLVLRAQRGVEPLVEFEMLEGMANHQARAVQAQAGGLLLYAPVVKAEDFHSAIAYLVRRLDENTAPENFLRHLFGLTPESEAWLRERDRFLAATRLTASVSGEPRRRQDRRAEPGAPGPLRPLDAPFANEPDTDWSLPASRAWIDGVVERWRRAAPAEIPLEIGGAVVADAGWADGEDPSRPRYVAYRYGRAGPAEIDRALDAARSALRAWEARSPTERRMLLRRGADVLARRRGDLIGAMILDGAKTVPEADAEVSEAVDFARYYADAPDLGDDVADCRPRPLGVVVVAPPWNFPLSIAAGGAVAALAAGNAALLKPAPEAVLVGRRLAEALWDAGIPRDALQFVPCEDGEVGRALIVDPRVDAVILTGSAATARMFLDWRPALRLFAETSGKNSLIVTALADRDQAVRDLVRSAFGHNAQKCSAASLAVCEAEVYDDVAFRRQLRDAAASLAVGSAWDLASRITPLTQAPGADLQRALTTLDEGEEWLLEPRQLDDNPRLWSAGIKLGVRPGSFFHRTESFGPVLGLMRAADLDEAIRVANETPFGLTSGLHSLDDREVGRWQERIEAGNLYVNRAITGAIVRRQPFGGWKQSGFGPGAKAGGPNYVVQLAHWRQVAPPTGLDPCPASLIDLLRRCLSVVEAADQPLLSASAGSYARAWRTHFALEHDPGQILGERNVFRYRPCPGLLVRAAASSPASRLDLARVVLAARTCGAALTVSVPPVGADLAWLHEVPGVWVVKETDADLVQRLPWSGFERLRAWEPLSRDVRVEANRAHVAVLDAPILANGRLELRAYVREQTLSHVIHRYGNLTEAPAPDVSSRA
jgi:RHH-type transcriptional regulator, proline utilization regulon repressor / proline dehydrogenase / delta 1-pyrroline-5-carboxylate dehydrogenase